jgi:hypothetical protein
MARPTIPLGSWGKISTWVTETNAKGKATQAKFRDMDGHIRAVSAYGPNKTSDERALLKKLRNRTRTGHSTELTTMHKISDRTDWGQTECTSDTSSVRPGGPWLPIPAWCLPGVL